MKKEIVKNLIFFGLLLLNKFSLPGTLIMLLGYYFAMSIYDLKNAIKDFKIVNLLWWLMKQHLYIAFIFFVKEWPGHIYLGLSYLAIFVVALFWFYFKMEDTKYAKLTLYYLKGWALAYIILFTI